MSIANIQPHERLREFWPLLRIALDMPSRKPLPAGAIVKAQTFAEEYFKSLPVRFASAPFNGPFIQVELHGFFEEGDHLYADMILDGEPSRPLVGKLS